MPSIIPGYVYSLFAALIVGTIVVASCSAVMLNIKNNAESQQLSNITEYIAAQSIVLLSQSNGNNSNSTQNLELPSQIGTQAYWIRITNDSNKAWIEAGFGTTPIHNQHESTIPASVTASGTIVSTSGRASLNCVIENQSIVLKLTEGYAA